MRIKGIKEIDINLIALFSDGEHSLGSMS